jgi:hypothetical protein
MENEVGYEGQTTQNTQNILSKELVFKHAELGITKTAPPNHFTRPGKIKDFLLSLLPKDSIQYQSISSDKYFTTNINKVLRSITNPAAANASLFEGKQFL